MSILKVARMGHPVLRQKARELTAEEIRSPAIQRLIGDMVETMREYGGIGLAAPQVHHSLRLALIEFSDESARYPNRGEQGLTVFINPRITVLDSTEQAFWEGCLSVPGMRGLVHRPRTIRVDFISREGKSESIEAAGFLATVFQHEFDHLDGVLYIDRLKDTRKLAFQEEYERYLIPAADAAESELPD